MRISDLADAPQFAGTIANRGWTAWWTDSGRTEAEYRAGVEAMIAGAGIPFALVAQAEGRYLGSVLVIDSDLEARPQYTPWIAALWVEPDARRQGVALALIEAARQRIHRLGYPRCYLCATPRNAPYYLARGFRLIESGVEGLEVLTI